MAHVSNAELADSFDGFYKAARDRLLLQTFALTGDLAVARSAVREAFVVAWHHWRKTSQLPDPESSVRPAAWRRALRRSSTRPWARKRDVGEQARRILDALGALPVNQRKALLLTQLAAVTMTEMAHEVGLPQEAAERELQLGAAHLARQLEIPTSAIPAALSSLAEETRSVTWPRVTIIRRAGLARRRAHTVLGGATAVVALVVGGAIVMDPAGSQPTLDREPLPSSSAPPPSGPAVNRLPDTSLLTLDTVREELPGGRWRQGRTDDNSAGNGLVLPCQPVRYADQRGTAAWVRVFRGGPAKKKSTRSLTQFAESSANPRRAERTYRRTLRWFSACLPASDESAPPARLQLVSTASVPGVGDRASILVLRSHVDRTTYVVGVARSGLVTTTTALSTDVPARRANRDGLARLLASAVGRICALADGGACADDGARAVDRAPYPVAGAGWFLSEIDLPPINTDQGPWIGTRPAGVTDDRIDSGAIGCDTVRLAGTFRGKPIRRNQARTFVLGGNKLPPEVGLTQTVGSLPLPAARRFVDRFRAQMAACPDLDATAGTEVDRLDATDRGARASSTWHLRTALPGDRTVEYDVAVLRKGTAVSVLVYVSAPRARIAGEDFVALTRRALERLDP